MLKNGVVFRGATVIDGTGGAPLKDMDVVVDSGKIQGLHPSGRRRYDEHAIQVIDARGKTVMPGFIDAHMHFYMDGDVNYVEDLMWTPATLKAIRAVKYAQRLLESGVTTVRASGDGNDYMAVSLREAIEAGYVVGPRVIASGYHLTLPGGHGYYHPPWLLSRLDMGKQCSGVEEFRRAAREELAYGVDSIKLVATRGMMTKGEPGAAQLTVAEMAAAVEEAHKRGKLAEAHCVGADGIINAVEAGIDSIAHGTYLNDRGMELLASSRVGLAPTLSVVEVIAKLGDSAGVAPFLVRKCLEARQYVRANFKRWVDAGIRIAMGGDYGGVPLLHHGENLRELAHMVEFGMTEMQAIVAGTRVAAEVLGIGHLVGTVRQDMVADLLLVDGNPLEDISLLADRSRIKIVMKGGAIVVSRV